MYWFFVEEIFNRRTRVLFAAFFIHQHTDTSTQWSLLALQVEFVVFVMNYYSVTFPDGSKYEVRKHTENDMKCLIWRKIYKSL